MQLLVWFTRPLVSGTSLLFLLIPLEGSYESRSLACGFLYQYEAASDSVKLMEISLSMNTGYSVVRSLSEAPLYAAAIASALKVSDGKPSTSNSQEAALQGTIHLTTCM